MRCRGHIPPRQPAHATVPVVEACCSIRFHPSYIYIFHPVHVMMHVMVHALHTTEHGLFLCPRPRRAVAGRELGEGRGGFKQLGLVACVTAPPFLGGVQRGELEMAAAR